MREATGELTITVVVVIAVGLLVAFFSTTLYPNIIKPNIQKTADCADAICEKQGQSIGGCNPSTGMVCCKVKGSQDTIQCPYKG